MKRRELRPDFLIVGAPKAGTTALHGALARHPEVFMSTPKEAKYFLCDGTPPPRWRGPGDLHSRQEWIWHPQEYADLFAPAPAGTVRGESTPFYLWSHDAHHRIAATLPEVRLIAVVRDPIERAYSNWMHLWCDGLEPVAHFPTAFGLQDERAAAGYAPFWRYRELGLYGEQLAHLFDHVDRDRVLVLRYGELVDDPADAVDRACRFLGITPGLVDEVPGDNSRSYLEPGWRTRTLGPIVRAGAWLGQFAPPQVWRQVSPPLVRQLGNGSPAPRPVLDATERAELVHAFADDVKLLGEVTGHDFSPWLSTVSEGSFQDRAGRA